MTRGFTALLYLVLISSSMQIEAQVIGSVTDRVSGIGIEGVAVSNGSNVGAIDIAPGYVKKKIDHRFDARLGERGSPLAAEAFDA